MAAMADERHADRLVRLGDRQLHDLHLHAQHPRILQEQRLADVIRNTLDQREVHADRQRGGRRVLEIEVILRGGQRRVRVEPLGAHHIHGERNPQRLRQVSLLRIDAGQDLHFEIVDFELKTVFHRRASSRRTPR
jgi:hypothetical protein